MISEWQTKIKNPDPNRHSLDRLPLGGVFSRSATFHKANPVSTELQYLQLQGVVHLRLSVAQRFVAPGVDLLEIDVGRNAER
jgi:hypothetical protein